MKIFGHPLHLMFVHFPSGLFPMDVVCYAIFYFYGDESFGKASFYAVFGGTVTAWLAVISGVLDLMKIPSGKTRVINKALVHGSINTTVVIGFSVFAWMGFTAYPHLPEASLSVLILKVLLVISMIIANYFGGSLVLRDGVGTENIR